MDIQLYIKKVGGHSWLGGFGTIVGYDPSEFIDASQLMISFFNNHSLYHASNISHLPEQQLSIEYINENNNRIISSCTISNYRIFNLQQQLIQQNSVHNKKELDMSIANLPNGKYNISINEGQAYLHFVK